MAARRKGKPKLTIGDRLITAFMGFVVVFLTTCLVWLLTLRIWFVATDTPPPFHWTWIAGLVAAAGGFLFGPERMLDGIGAIWRAIGDVWGTIGDVFYRPGRF
jgi:sugar phosphate permease